MIFMLSVGTTEAVCTAVSVDSSAAVGVDGGGAAVGVDGGGAAVGVDSSNAACWCRR